MHETEVYNNVSDTESLANQACKRYLLGIIFCAVIEGYDQSKSVLILVEHGNGVHSSAHYNHRIFHFQNVLIRCKSNKNCQLCLAFGRLSAEKRTKCGAETSVYRGNILFLHKIDSALANNSRLLCIRFVLFL